MKNGFTLIEIIIALSMVAILTIIAYPSYRDYISRGRRADGQSALLNLATRMERYYSEHNTYQTATIGSSAATDVLSTNQSSQNWYTIAISNATASSYTLTATPNGAQGTGDTSCQTLTLNSQGTKGIAAGPAGSPTSTVVKCW